MKIGVVIPSAGAGRRLRLGRSPGVRGVPKALVPLAGRPLFRHAVDRLVRLNGVREVVLAVPRGFAPAFRRHLDRPAAGGVRIRLTAGGATRAASVWRALKRFSSSITHVLVHDGARPLVTARDLARLIAGLGKSDGVVLGRPVVPTLKELNGRLAVSRTLDRSRIWEAETPQFFKRPALLAAFRAAGGERAQATDCASLIERWGGRVTMREARDPNPKITTSYDLHAAEALLGTPLRTGVGWDVHRLVPGRPLWIGGVKVPFERGALGHSDGDVLLHALTDALLGAVGAGDIGEKFPDTSRRTLGLASAKMLGAAARELTRRGWKPASVDAVVILERPRLAPYKDRMRRLVARLLDLPTEAVSIKAKTAEGLGAVGRGEALEAQAVATVVRNLS